MPNYIRPRGTLDLYENQAQIYQTIIQTCQKNCTTLWLSNDTNANV